MAFWYDEQSLKLEDGTVMCQFALKCNGFEAQVDLLTDIQHSLQPE